MTETSRAPKRALAYARISNKDTRVPKVGNQVLICEGIADYEGYALDPTDIFADDGKAASGKAIDDTTLGARPGAQACLAAIRSGRYDVLIAVEGERLARTYLDGLEWIRASAEGGVVWHLDTDGLLNPATPAGEETAVSIFAQGRREGRVRNARQTRRYDRERAAGNPLWGTRPFGYENDRVTIRESEAVLIREAVVDYLAARRSMLRIAHDWNAAGVKTDGMLPTKADIAAGRMVRMRKGRDGEMHPVRGLWTASTVRQLLLRPRNAGLYLHHGVELRESRIQPIIDRAQHEALKARIESGAPVRERAHTLLGGIIRCECGAPMHGTVSYSQRKGGPRHVYQHYKCSQALYDKSRRHASIVQRTADDLFVAWIWLDLFTGNLDTPGEDVTGGLDRISAQLIENAESIAHVGGVLLDVKRKSLHGQAEMSLARLDMEREALEAERDLLLARAAEGGALAAFLHEWRRRTKGFSSDAERVTWEAQFYAVWEGVPLDRKRAMIRARYRPTVALGGRGAGRISPNPVDPATFAQPTQDDDQAADVAARP
jgi:DNA invertase Pin-like site-specific DNA recombinase